LPSLFCFFPFYLVVFSGVVLFEHSLRASVKSYVLEIKASTFILLLSGIWEKSFPRSVLLPACPSTNDKQRGYEINTSHRFGITLKPIEAQGNVGMSDGDGLDGRRRTKKDGEGHVWSLDLGHSQRHNARRETGVGKLGSCWANNRFLPQYCLISFIFNLSFFAQFRASFRTGLFCLFCLPAIGQQRK